MTGLTVVGGGFVYVRGLGDRYSLALLNGSPLPSPEPLRRAVPLDLFPTDIIASSLVQKTYSPNFTGEFGGGVINLTTLAIPKMPFLKFSAGMSGDTETTATSATTTTAASTTGPATTRAIATRRRRCTHSFASGERMSAGAVDSGAIAQELVGRAMRWCRSIDSIPSNYSGNVTRG